jgi:hypothetical protein
MGNPNPSAPAQAMGTPRVLIAALVLMLLTGGARVATASDEAAGAIKPRETSSSPWTLRLGSGGPARVPSSPAEGPAWVQGEPRGRSPYALLPRHSPDDIGLGEGWALLAADEKALSGKGGEEPKRAGPDWPGIGRDTAFFVGYQFVSVGILYVLPGDLNRWSDKDVSLSKWWDNVRQPVWDSDPWATNYLSHPYWGATYYIRARERGFGKLASFGYSALLSTLYEYGPEAFFEPPSGQDLLVTPILGSLIGAFIFEPIRDRIKVKPELKWYDHAILIGTDPLGALNSVFERLLGIKSDIRVNLTPPASAETADLKGRRGDRPRSHGVSMKVDIVWE